MKVEYWKTGSYNFHILADNGEILAQSTQGYENESEVLEIASRFGDVYRRGEDELVKSSQIVTQEEHDEMAAELAKATSAIEGAHQILMEYFGVPMGEGTDA